MSCKDRENDLLPYLDNRLDPAAAAKVEAHLKSCAACRKDVDQMRATWKVLGYLPGRNPSRQLPDRILEAARLQLEIEKRWTHRLRRHLPVIASAAVVLLVFAVTMMLGHARDPLAGLSAEERAVVHDLDLYENLDTVQNIDVLEDTQTVEYLDDISSMSDEDL